MERERLKSEALASIRKRPIRPGGESEARSGQKSRSDRARIGPRSSPIGLAGAEATLENGTSLLASFLGASSLIISDGTAESAYERATRAATRLAVDNTSLQLEP